MVSDVPADGNCALHAVCEQLSLQGIVQNASSLRRNCVDFLKIQSELLDEGFLEKRRYRNRQEYLAKQAVDGHWCDEAMLRSVAAIYCAEIHILHDSGHMTKLNPAEFLPLLSSSSARKAEYTIMLGQIGELHYISLRPLTGPTDHTVDADLVDVDDASPTENLPEYLKPNSWNKWREKRPWLEMKNKKVVCKV